MDHKTQIALTKRVFAHLDNKSTDTASAIMRNAATAYTSPDRLALETEKLFRQEPLLITMSCHMPAPGDYVTDDNTDVPILVVRGDDGQVRAFLNVCQHRASRLVNGSGHLRKHLICPYHAWSFDKAGKFSHAPSQKDFDGFDFDNCSLTELPAAEQGGLIWVRPQGTTPIDVTEHLAGLAPELDNFSFENYHLYESREIFCEMNWKTIIDTFLEPYHFAALHKTTVGPLLFGNLCLMDEFGRNLRETLPRKSILDLKDQPESDWDLIWHTAMVYVLFPNTVFVMQRDHAEVWRCFPVDNDPGKSRVLLDFYIPEPVETEKAGRYWKKNMDMTVRTVLEEDFPVGEAAQKNLANGTLPHVIYGQNEPALAYFQRMINEAVDGTGD
ncbi:MAG: Rieske 2Fe-2S domain-containing protein [Alphaproteobacteria bacterium]|jgi:phenylpropionate dioxygenase-like ring-hydroxylating dioxygenase large terminal subunit|nr:Rieske 2Fe-2S domain-containing protein [Alphaproteobacteria bacterium]MBT4020705.1 Rieske 2Fe-2S domain-containing protein [Alphaproteobacteria bacterium]MBT4966058.1 Rieske 2Fe-2S domain-containing protein [Alphaproteobacteria bacterium]MBT5161512.1 Rieske 2Fe-2S domain-containing protein [Alphaproteobacteria bacterium]MBT5919940.1 Rieske 2Fe-2S domain-containing protein [Alphaproteobacteria bacterium]